MGWLVSLRRWLAGPEPKPEEDEEATAELPPAGPMKPCGHIACGLMGGCSNLGCR